MLLCLSGFPWIIAVALAFVPESVFGQSFMGIVTSTLFISLAGNPDSYKPRLKGIREFTLPGANITVFAWLFGGEMWPVRTPAPKYQN